MQSTIKNSDKNKKEFPILSGNTAKEIILNSIINTTKYANFIIENNNKIAEACTRLKTSAILTCDSKKDIRILTYYYKTVGYGIEPIIDDNYDNIEDTNNRDSFVKCKDGKYRCKIYW